MGDQNKLLHGLFVTVSKLHGPRPSLHSRHVSFTRSPPFCRYTLKKLTLRAPLAAAVSSAKRVPCGSQRSCSTFSASTSA